MQHTCTKNECGWCYLSLIWTICRFFSIWKHQSRQLQIVLLRMSNTEQYIPDMSNTRIGSTLYHSTQRPLHRTNLNKVCSNLFIPNGTSVLRGVQLKALQAGTCSEGVGQRNWRRRLVRLAYGGSYCNAHEQRFVIRSHMERHGCEKLKSMWQRPYKPNSTNT